MGKTKRGKGTKPVAVELMSKHRDPKTVIRYDRGRENLEQNALNVLLYEEGLWS